MGCFMFVRGGLILKNWWNLHLFIVFQISIWGSLVLCLEGLRSPTPPPWRQGWCTKLLCVVHIALICSATLSFDQVHFKHEQSQVLSPDSHVTIGTIQQMQGAANVHRAYWHNSRHAAWPTITLRFMETRWKTLALSTGIWIGEKN